MIMDSRIPMMGQSPDIMGQFSQGMQTRQMERDNQQTNAFRSMLQQQGPGIIQGDANALAQLAQFDPQAALGVQSTRQDMDVQRQNAARAAAQWAQTQDAATIEREAETLRRILRGAAQFHQRGDEQGYNAWLQQQGADPAQFPFAQFPAHAAMVGGILEGLTGERFGLSPVTGIGPDGPQLFQIGDRGTLRQLPMPEGVTPSLGNLQRVDQGTGTAMVDPRTGETVQFLPAATVDASGRYVAPGSGAANPADPSSLAGGVVPGSEAERTRTQEQADRALTIERGMNESTMMLDTIDGILNDPALDSATGWQSFRQQIPGTETYRFGQRMAQLQGQVFLEAYQRLRGGGAITNVEGVRAEQALARLATSQRPEDLRAALSDLRAIVVLGQNRLRQRSGMSGAPTQGGSPSVDTSPSQAPATPPAAQGNVPDEAVRMLLDDPTPEAMREFDEVFGPGAARQFLGSIR